MKKKIPVLISCFLLSSFTMYAESATMQELSDALKSIKIPDADSIKGNIHLPLIWNETVTFSWSSSNESIIKTSEGSGYTNLVKTPGGVVTRGNKNENISLYVTARKDGESLSDTLNVVVIAKKETDPFVGYLYAYFSGDESRLDDQQIYFSISKDGITWEDLNENNPVLVSVLGDKGVRDPYIVRSIEGDKFFLIATDLDIRHSKYGGSWGNMSSKGSTYIMVWESTDLVNWSQQRMVDVSSSASAGNTWAPESIFDEKTGEYLVYWSSRVSTDGFAKQRIYISKTRDFYAFTKPVVFVEESNAVIDASIFKSGNTYYRLIKDENILAISLSSATQLLDYSNSIAIGNSYQKITNTELESYKGGYEGPTMFQFINEQKWCALVDEYTGSKRGYIPFISSNIAAGNSLHLMANNTYLMPTGAKHGTVIPVTQKEYDALISKWSVPQPNENVSESPVLFYDFNETLAGTSVTDKSGNNHHSTLFGNSTYATDPTKGKVLYLDGTSGTYLSFPKGFFDGRTNMTISMDIRPESDATNHFTLGIGQNDDKYLFLRTRANQVRTAITTLNWSKEKEVITTGSFKSRWFNIKIVMEGHKMSLYIDNVLKSTNSYARTINDLGTNLLAYLGKSFYSSDPYFKGYFDNFKVYNRAMTESEISTGLKQTFEDNVSVYPVPFENNLTIKLDNNTKKPVIISIFDAFGRIKDQFVCNNNETTLNTTNYTTGIYLLKLQKGGNSLTKVVSKK